MRKSTEANESQLEAWGEGAGERTRLMICTCYKISGFPDPSADLQGTQPQISDANFLPVGHLGPDPYALKYV